MATDPDTRPSHVLVIGSINMDLVTQVQQLPRPGQTVIGQDLRESPGGKGANQAVAAARLGARCSMVGCVGSDGFGDRLLQGLAANGVDTAHVGRVADCSSGVALIGVEAGGENAITIIPGANAHVSIADVAACETLLRQADVLLLQLEIPLETVAAALALARRHGVQTVLNPAPVAGPLPPELFQVEVLCPNELEAAVLTGTAIRDLPDARRAAEQLRQQGPRHVLITLGAQGVMVCAETGNCEHIPAFAVTARDTTGAGDAFAAAIGVALAQRWPLREAVRFACAAGALAATRPGAQDAMPRRADVKELLRQQEGAADPI